MLHYPFTYKPTVKISLFSLFLLSRLHGNFGLNQMVSMSHLLSLFMCDLTLNNGKIKSSIYGILTEVALLVECLAWLLARIVLHALYAWSNSSKKAILIPKLQILVHCCYVQQHGLLRKKERICFIIHLLIDQLSFAFLVYV